MVPESDAAISVTVSIETLRRKVEEAGFRVEHEDKIRHLLQLLNIQLIVSGEDDVVMDQDSTSDAEDAAAAADVGMEPVAAEERDLARLQSVVNDTALKSAVIVAITSSEMDAQIPPNSYRLVSHYILTMLMLKCFTKTITLSSLTLKHFLDHISTKHYVLMRIHNGSSIALDHLDFFILRSYVSIFRPVLPTDSVESYRSILMLTQDGKPFSSIPVTSCQFQNKHRRDDTFKAALPTEAYNACIKAYVEAVESGDYSLCDPRCIYMPQFMMKETDPVAHVLKINMMEFDFQRHLLQLKNNSRNIVIPGILRQNLPGPLDLPRSFENSSQVVDGVPCKPLMDAWKKQAVSYFRRRPLSFDSVRQWLLKQPGADLIQPAKQLDRNIHHVYAFVKMQQMFQHTRGILFKEFPNNEPSTEQAREFIAKHKLNTSFRTTTSLQQFHRDEAADHVNHPQASVNRKVLKQKTLELEKIKDAAYYEGVRTQVWPGLLEVTRGVRGRAIVATTRFKKGDLICNYNGDSFYETDASNYEKEAGNTTYLFHCNDNGRTFVIDSIDESKWAPSPGRLINHSIRHPNLKPELIKRPCKAITLGFKAIRLINPGEELLFNYGDNRKDKDSLDAWYDDCPCMHCLPLGDTFGPDPPARSNDTDTESNCDNTYSIKKRRV